MSIDPVKIPQNVYVEDRIIGPITLKQIMIVMISAGISYAIWAAMKSAGPVSSIQSGLAWTPTVLGVVFAFVKINGLSLLRIILLLLERLDKPATRIWVPRQGIYVNIVTKQKKKAPDSRQAPADTKGNDHIQELSRVLDKGPEEEEEEDGIVPTKKTETPPKPVNPKRVQAERRKKPVDDIAPPDKDDKRTGGGGLLRDISPPPSHA